MDRDPISRRKLILGLAAGALAPWPLLAAAQERKYRLGVLVTNSASQKLPHWIAFFRRLGELGLVEGRNLVIEVANAENRPERLPALAADLARRKCDVFFSGAARRSWRGCCAERR